MTSAINSNDKKNNILIAKPLPSVKSSYKTPLITRLYQKITSIIESIFAKILFWRKKKVESDWTGRQVDILNTIKVKSFKEARKECLKETHKVSKIGKTPPVESTKKGEAEKPKSHYEGKEFNPSLKKMRESLKKIVNSAIDCVYDLKIEPLLEKREDAMVKATEIIKFLAELVIKMGSQAKGPVFQKLDENHLNKGSQVVDDSLNKTLSWLTSQEKESLKIATNETLAKKILSLIDEKKLVIPEGHQTNSYLECVSNWIFDSNRSNDIFEYLRASPEFKDRLPLTTEMKEAVSTIHQTIIMILVEKKIDSIQTAMKKILIEDLPDLLKNTIKSNAERLTDELSGRFAELLSNIDCRNIINEGIEVVFNHTKSWLAAKEKVEKRVKNANLTFKSAEEKEEYLRKELPEEFAKLPQTHPTVRATYLKKPEGFTDAQWRASIEYTLTSEIAEKMLKLLLPDMSVHAEDGIHEVDGITHLWNQLVIPKEIDKLTGELEHFLEQIAPTNIEIKENVKKYIKESARLIVVNIVKAELRIILQKLLSRLMSDLLYPDNFDSFVSHNVLPKIHTLVVSAKVNSVISCYIGVFEDVLRELRENENTSQTYRKLEQMLWNKTRETLFIDPTATPSREKTFEEVIGLDRATFSKEIAIPLIKRLEIAMKNEENKMFTPRQVVEKYFEATPDGDSNIYSEIIMNLVFKIGDYREIHKESSRFSLFGNLLGSVAEKMAPTFAGTIDKIVSNSLKIFKATPHASVDIIMDTLKEKYTQKDELEKLFFTSRPKLENPQETLDGQFYNIAVLCHSMIVDTSPTLGNLMSSTKNVQTLIKRIYRRVFGGYYLNSELVHRIKDLVTKQFDDSDTLVKAQNAI